MVFKVTNLFLIFVLSTMIFWKGNLLADDLIIIKAWNKSEEGQIEIQKPSGEWAKINAPETGETGLKANLNNNTGMVHMNKDGSEYVFGFESVKDYKKISVDKGGICLPKDQNGVSSGMGC